MQSVRHLTVGYITRRSQLRMEVRDPRGGLIREKIQPVYLACPTLKLSGAWMAEAGFHEGDPVRVEVSHGQLIITLKGGPEA